MIIILGVDYEDHAKHVAKTLKEKGHDYIIFDTRKYPLESSINWIPTDNNKGYVKIDNKKINFSDIQGVYWRNFSDISYQEIEDAENTEFLSRMVERERRSALHSLFYSLDINWVNSMNAFDLHKKKAFLTSQFKKNGIRVPKTLITNDKEGFLKFYEENNKKLIYKPILGGSYTQFVKEEHITEEYLQRLQISPVQFQEFIDGVDIRVYAYGRNIYALQIDSETVDFREDANAKLTPIELPENVKNDCFKMMEIAGLKYSGIDIRLNKEGEYVFLEANPAPMFIYAEKKTGFPLTQELINLLIS